MEPILKRDYKNSVFIDLFERDSYRLQLFQVLHPEMQDVTAGDIQTITLKQVITNHQYNDLAFLVKDKLMVFVEAQSTWSLNILIRILLYFADTIQQYLHDHELDIHDTSILPLPKPEFYVIYTGNQPVPERISLREHFFEDECLKIDLEAQVITAETSDIIGQYIIFSHVLDDQVKKLGRTREAAQEAIKISKDRGALIDYLNEQEKEVIDIMVMLFDQEYAVEQYAKTVARKSREEGMLETLVNLVKMGKLTIEEGIALSKQDRSVFEAMLAQS